MIEELAAIDPEELQANHKSLKLSGYEAKAHYDNHRRAASGLKDELAWAAKNQDVPSAQRSKAVELAQLYYDRSIQSGRHLAESNASDLHDLAVIEAHLGGVAIKVEQPLSIGEAVDVHVS